MFARVLIYQFNVDKLDEATKRVEDKVMPDLKSRKGFSKAYIFSNRKTGKGIAMTIWDSEEDALADERSGAFKERVSWVSDFFKTQPVREGYEVSAQS
jgi:heme-degrading monooxygenase HmoA